MVGIHSCKFAALLFFFYHAVSKERSSQKGVTIKNVKQLRYWDLKIFNHRKPIFEG